MQSVGFAPLVLQDTAWGVRAKAREPTACRQRINASLTGRFRSIAISGLRALPQRIELPEVGLSEPLESEISMQQVAPRMGLLAGGRHAKDLAVMEAWSKTDSDSANLKRPRTRRNTSQTRRQGQHQWLVRWSRLPRRWFG